MPSPADLPDPGIKPGSPELQADSSPTELSGEPIWLQHMESLIVAYGIYFPDQGLNLGPLYREY